MSAPSLLSAAAGTGRQSRSGSKAVVKAASGYHVFHIDGYSLTKTIPGGQRISSQDFTVGGRTWRVDLYPNGTDKRSKDESDSMALYLVYRGEEDAGHRDDVQPLKRLVAEYKFSLLDHAGNAAYELPSKKGVFKRSRRCGHDTFIRRDELEEQHGRLLLKNDSLAIRCDVGVVDQLRLQSIDIEAKRKRSRRSGYSDTESSGNSHDTDAGSSSYSDNTDTGSSSYSDSDDSCFGTDSDDSRSSRRRSKSRRRRRQAASSP